MAMPIAPKQLPKDETPELQSDIGIAVKKTKQTKGVRDIRAKLQTIVKKLVGSHSPGWVESETWRVGVAKQGCNEVVIHTPQI